MGEKDIAEKTLLELPDVFADVHNVLYFHGKAKIRMDDLESLPGFSAYTSEGKLHKQERDVVKLWKPGGLCFALFGIENQTRPDPDIALRVMSYDAAAYRAQLSARFRYPVVTTVVFFGNTHWSGPKSLKERVPVSAELDPFVNDFKVNVAEVAFFTQGMLNQFTSDFRQIADFFVNSRLDRNYRGSTEQITHVREYCQLMKVLTNDERFDNIDLNEFPKGGLSMHNLIDQWLDTGRAEGIATGIDRGISMGIDRGISMGIDRGRAEERATMRSNIQTLLNNGQITKETAALLLSNFK